MKKNKVYAILIKSVFNFFIMQKLSFHILKETTAGRLGLVQTAHGAIETPAFLFCATKGALKSLCIDQIDTQILLSNTYHLMIQPGSDLIEKMGGLHRFMGWSKPIFTDSGGYQIFSLGHGSVSDEIKGKRCGARSLTRITEEGALFKSYRNGENIFLTPERAIHVQKQLGSDLMCVLDECTPFHVTKDYTQKSMLLSHRWALRSLAEFERSCCPHGYPQGLYGIVQGGIYDDLRRESADFINSQAFFGHAIGGSLGCTRSQMHEIVQMTRGFLSGEKPVHLLGIGGLKDIIWGVSCGIDTFDCVSPTRLGRHGGALIRPHYWDTASEKKHGRESINLFKSCFQEDSRPIDESCPCSTCYSYSRAYLHHLLKAKELTAMSALTVHNMVFMDRFMYAIRQGIQDESLSQVQKEWINEE
jgi:queuine tRNA-ribosyltransferase